MRRQHALVEMSDYIPLTYLASFKYQYPARDGESLDSLSSWHLYLAPEYNRCLASEVCIGEKGTTGGERVCDA